MKLNIIHLPHRTDRLKRLKVELERQYISNYQLWDGIIDKELPCRGISQAHKRIVRNAKEKGLPYVLIGEDDMRFTDLGAFEFYIRKMPMQFDLYLGGIYHGILNEHNLVRDFTGLTLYMIHQRFYDQFLNVREDQHIDIVMRELNGTYIVCNPFVVSQYEGFSDNQCEEVNYNHILMQREFYNIYWHG